MNAPLRIGMASVLALATASPVLAQQPQYQPYEYRKDAYDVRRDNYEVSRADYQAARADYERRRAMWERQRADYDARHGYGAYIRVYGPAPIWDTARWGAYDAPSAGYYGRPTA